MVEFRQAMVDAVLGTSQKSTDRRVLDRAIHAFDLYATHDSLRTHLATFFDAYNFAKRLKSLRGLTSFERMCQRWTEQPQRFRPGTTT
jgi:hypothetical protein